MKKLNILALSGSLRVDSYNRMLLNALEEVALDSCDFSYLSLQDIPVYNQDEEDDLGIPTEIKEMQDRLIECDGLMIATPEYNHGVPGVLKNAVDWLTRPPEKIESVFHDLPLGLVGVTPGLGGTVLAQKAWQPILQTLRVKVFRSDSLALSEAGYIFNNEGEVLDYETRNDLKQFMRHYSKFVKAHTRNSLPDYYYRDSGTGDLSPIF